MIAWLQARARLTRGGRGPAFRRCDMKAWQVQVGSIAAALLFGAPASAQTPVPRVADVVWPDDSIVGASSGGPAFADAERTLMPVLVPRRFPRFKSLVFVGEPLAYTASVRATGASLSITGTRVSFDTTGVTPPVSQDETEVFAEVGEKSASAGYVRFGVAYKVDVECEALADARCRDAAYARALLDSVELVGGGRAPPAEAPQFPQAAIEDMVSAQALSPDFARPAGELAASSGSGVTAATVYAPGIRFPLMEAPAYLNSQVYGVGGTHGPSGGWSDPRNYRYPWRDNFCEARGYATPMCPTGRGHQGQDMRPKDRADQKHWAVAVEDGQIARLGSYSVVLKGASGTEYRYLHLEMARLRVRAGQRVKRGDPIGLVSNDFGKTSTTVHLHFEILQNVDGRGLRHVPPYTSLVQAYAAM